MREFLPMKRQHNVRVEEFQGEVLVHELDSHRAHCLNGVAVAVWNLCDGTRTVAQIAAAIAVDRDGPPDEDLVWTALTELDTASLLDTPIEASVIEPSRRAAIARLGWAAAIPLVLSIAVPQPAHAQSPVLTSL